MIESVCPNSHCDEVSSQAGLCPDKLAGFFSQELSVLFCFFSDVCFSVQIIIVVIKKNEVKSSDLEGLLKE